MVHKPSSLADSLNHDMMVEAILYMGIIVSTSLTFFAHAVILSRLGVLFSPSMACALKTHSSLLLSFILALYPRGSFVLSCTTALHFDHLHPFGLKPASLGLVFKPTFDHDYCEIKLACPCLL